MQLTNAVMRYDVVRQPGYELLVLECLQEGELFDYLIARQKLGEKEARNFFKQMLKALHYCHSEGVVHRDLKLENLLLDENHDLKVADFGFSKKMQNPYGPDGLCSTFVGSPAYSAPEIHENTEYDATAADVWSIGVILLTLLTGSHPFQDVSGSTTTTTTTTTTA